MKTFSVQEAIVWCRDHRIALNDRVLPDLDSAEFKFAIPNDAQKRVYLTKRAMEQFSDEQAVLVWFHDWSVWPSGQRIHIFDRLRISYGEVRRIIDAPAQLFQQMEIEDATSFVTLAVLFLWDCYVVSPNQNKLLFFSHDEYGVARGMDFAGKIPWLDMRNLI
jgi:hypothetical protein